MYADGCQRVATERDGERYGERDGGLTASPISEHRHAYTDGFKVRAGHRISGSRTTPTKRLPQNVSVFFKFIFIFVERMLFFACELFLLLTETGDNLTRRFSLRKI